MSPHILQPVERNIALAYVRLSNAPRVEKDESRKSKRLNPRNKLRRKRFEVVNELDSPERQRANIEAVCAKRGLKIEWFEDVDGHRSGTSEKNRPGWLALKKRLADPDVAAVVANDLSRLHRKSARVSDLLDMLEENDTDLILAAPGREVDTSTPMGQMFAMMAAMFDEYYAKDISVRAKDSIAHRKSQGKAINLPFGTQRDADGYLEKSEEGAWLMPDGHHEPGFNQEDSPDAGALWRGYADCTERILTVYAENKHGAELLAYELNLEGWAFRERDEGLPRPIDKEDIRRVIHNWPEYGGVILGGRARHRSPQAVNPDTVQLIAERAVFEPDLLVKVARVLRLRTHEQHDHSIKRTSRPYALNGMLYCAHCEQHADEQDNPILRSKLWGKTGKDSRYRHRDGAKGCGCANRSVPRSEVEADIGRLLHLMCVREDVVQEMVEQAAKVPSSDKPRIDHQKKNALDRCQRRMQAAKRLFRDGDMEEAEYDAILNECEEEVQTWNRITSERDQLEYELKAAVEILSKLSALWDVGTVEQRQSLIRSLFAHLIVDLDARRIVNFKLKPWAERFIELRIQAENLGLNSGDVRWSRRESNPRHQV